MMKSALAGFAIFVTVMAFSARQLWDLHRLATRAAVTVGRVTTFEANSHATVHYAFEVTGRVYEGAMQGAPRVSAGEDIKVFYLPDDPTVSVAAYPEDLWRYEIQFSLLAACCLSVVGGWQVSRLGRRREVIGV
jgi:hypothetical protein